MSAAGADLASGGGSGAARGVSTGRRGSGARGAGGAGFRATGRSGLGFTAAGGLAGGGFGAGAWATGGGAVSLPNGCRFNSTTSGFLLSLPVDSGGLGIWVRNSSSSKA